MISESQIQKSILQLLNSHPSVAWAHRMNTGAAKYKGKNKDYFVKFAFKGCSDIIGQMKTGHFLAIEVKREGGKATREQKVFIDNVKENGGLSCIAYSVDDVLSALETK